MGVNVVGETLMLKTDSIQITPPQMAALTASVVFPHLSHVEFSAGSA
jgi:hypothetical protein